MAPRARDHRLLRRLLLLGLTPLVVVGVAVASVGADRDGDGLPATTTTAAARPRPVARRAPPRPASRFVERRLGSLPAPVQAAAAAVVGRSRVLLLGGLTAQDTSTDGVLTASPAGSRPLARLPMQ